MVAYAFHKGRGMYSDYSRIRRWSSRCRCWVSHRTDSEKRSSAGWTPIQRWCLECMLHHVMTLRFVVVVVFFENATKIFILKKNVSTNFKSFWKNYWKIKKTGNIDFLKITINHGYLFSKSVPLTPGWAEPEFSSSTSVTRVVIIITRTRTVAPHISL